MSLERQKAFMYVETLLPLFCLLTTLSQGSFDVSVDGQVTTVDSTSTRNNYQKILFVAQGLAVGQHNLTIAATGSPFDIDYIKFTTGDGDSRCAWVLYILRCVR